MSRLPPKVAPLPVRAALGGRRRRSTSRHRSLFPFLFVWSYWLHLSLILFLDSVYLSLLGPLVFVQDCISVSQLVRGVFLSVCALCWVRQFCVDFRLLFWAFVLGILIKSVTPVSSALCI